MDKLSLENTLYDKNYSIVIPVTDKLGVVSRTDLTNLLESIEPEKWLDVIAGFDSVEWDFAQDFEAEYGEWLKIIWNQGKALNFTANVNLLLAEAFKNPACQGVFVVNQDCILPLVQELSLQPMVSQDALTSPRAVNDIDQITIFNAPIDEYRSEIMERPVPIDPWMVFKQIEKIAFYCICIPRTIYEAIGPLDSVFVKVFSDDDYCLRAQLAGFKVLEADVNVYHKGSFVYIEKPGDQSGSGCYELNDLGMGLMQYQFKWQTKEKHENIIKSILKEKNGLQ